jgi:geranylgeranyl diphosphate synthase type II
MVQTDLKPTLTFSSDFDLKTYLQVKKELVETALDESLPMGKPEKIYEAMRYSLLAGGKRLRPILLILRLILQPNLLLPVARQLLIRGAFS